MAHLSAKDKARKEENIQVGIKHPYEAKIYATVAEY
jgi:hypothetical protein